MDINNKKVIVQVGRLNNQKNHIFFIEVFDRLSKIDSNFVYIIVGNGELKSMLENEIKKRNLTDKVFFVGETNEVAKFYSASDLFILPSLFEGLGIVGVEAQANGIPCLFSNNVPRQVAFCNNVEFLELNVEIWLDTIINSHMCRNYNSYNDFINSPYNFESSALKLIDIYKKI